MTSLLLLHRALFLCFPPKFWLRPFSDLCKTKRILQSRPLTTTLLALTESPDSSQSPQPLLLQFSDCFDLPSEYFEQLPRDLRLDLNDAAFDLSNGPVIDECGQELGELLLNLSRAWELADISTSRAIASKLPMLEGTLTNKVKHLASIWYLLEGGSNQWDSMARVKCRDCASNDNNWKTSVC